MRKYCELSFMSSHEFISSVYVPTVWGHGLDVHTPLKANKREITQEKTTNSDQCSFKFSDYEVLQSCRRVANYGVLTCLPYGMFDNQKGQVNKSSVTRTQRPVRSLSSDRWSWRKKILYYIYPPTSWQILVIALVSSRFSQPFIVYMEDKDLFTNPCQLYSKL